MLRLLAASLLALSMALSCGSSSDGSADVTPDVPPAVDTAPEVGSATHDADADVVADADTKRESVDDVCDLACPAWQHCEWADSGMVCVDNVCDPACPVGMRCVDGECCSCCFADCAEGTHCEWSGEQAACVDDPCEPACPIEQHCEQGACVANVCTPLCMAYEYCGAQGECRPFACEPACEKEQHCEADNTCVSNDCPVDCHAAGCGLGYCNKDGECMAAACESAPLEPVCGLMDDGEGTSYEVFDSMCCLALAGNATVAACELLPVQPVCDLAGYVANPGGYNTYDNACVAGCAGVDLQQIKAGVCSCSMTCTEEELLDHPVCGTDCTDYTNLCELKCMDVALQYEHPCDLGCGLCPECLEDLESSCLDPVCGADGKTYLSMCDLQVCHPGTSFAYAGFCIGATCACAVKPAPVCGTLPGQEGWATIPNGCTANCLDATVWFYGVCSCCDPRPYAPVCAYNPLWDQWFSERNQCVVDSYGYASSSYPGPCVCCDAPGSIGGCCDLNQGPPVCGADGVTYANECALTCADVAKQNDGACACSAAWDPVCGQSVLEPGKQYTYGNACIAQSVYGVTSFTPGACELCTVACSVDGLDEVCGLDGVSYPNPCYLLKCNGDAVTKGLDDARCYDACESCP